MHVTKGLTDEQKQSCIEVMQKLQEKSISTMFAIPVNPERDNCPNYNEIILHPMDLSTVNKKLNENSYATISDWKKDVDLIWSNSLLYHKSNLMLRSITQEMQETFNTLSKFITDDPRRDWNNKLIFLRDKFFAETKAFENFTSESRRLLAQKQNGQKPKGQKGRKKGKKVWNRSGIIKLAKDINRLVEDDDLIAVLHILEEEEPNVKVEGDFLELNLTELKNTTLTLLRNKVDTLLPQQTTTQQQALPPSPATPIPAPATQES